MAEASLSPAAGPDAEIGPAQGRLPGFGPIAVVDIGSNSVRLVVYERLVRSPTPLFNEKVLCGLGRGLASTGRLGAEAVERALTALKRFRALATQMDVRAMHVMATAAVREAENGADFVAAAEAICAVPVEILSGAEEARRSACGVISGMWRPNGVAGDLGGGSLELVDVRGSTIGQGETLPLGGLRLQEISGSSPRKAARMVEEALSASSVLRLLEGRSFYAVGGTWRSLARLHMQQIGYPLSVVHGYRILAGEALEFCRAVSHGELDIVDSIDVVSKSRQPLLPYGAAVMEQVIRIGRPSDIIVSALGVREGLLFLLLDEEERARDPLLAASAELSILRSRSPDHARELIEWTDRLFAAIEIDETSDERRLRHAACLLADIGWRAHPDYRGEQSLNIIAHGAFLGIDHPGRAFLALSNYYRHMGLIDDQLSPRIRELVSFRLLERARILGAAFRVAYMISAAMPGVILRARVSVAEDVLILDLTDGLAMLRGDSVERRLKQLARLVGLGSRLLA